MHNFKMRPVTPRERRMLTAVEHGVDYELIAERFETTKRAAMTTVCRTRKRLRSADPIDAAGGRKAAIPSP